MTKKIASNFGATANNLQSQGIISQEVCTQLKDIHKVACEAKHQGWSSGLAYSAETFKSGYDNGVVSTEVYQSLMKINADANKGKHPY